MKSENLNRWLTLIANLGVLVGVIVLIFEINQATKLAETEAYLYRLDQMQHANFDFANSDYLPEIVEKAKIEGIAALSSIERSQLFGWEYSVKLRMTGHYHQYAQGYLSQEVADYILEAAISKSDIWRELGIDTKSEPLDLAIFQAESR